jgi:glycosyltransferase involved in cell wall biosynthesis
VRVLYLCPFVPWPLDSGGRIRTYHLIAAQRGHAEVHLRAIYEPGQGPAELGAVTAACASAEAFERGRAAPWRRLARTKLERWFHSPDLARAVRSELARGGYDLVHVDELLLARLVPRQSRVAVVQHHHKLDLDLYDTVHAHKGPQRHFDLWKLGRLEADAARRTRFHVLCSREDAAILAGRFPALECAAVPSGYDPDYWRPSSPAPARERELLVFVGTLSYGPNVDGARVFVRDVLPELRRRRPGLRLALVGRDPCPEVRALAGPGVEVVGAVPDVRPWLERAALAVVPLRIGGGTRLKIVEAIAMGCPVLSTEVGAEGLGLADREHLRLARDAAGFARAVDELLADRPGTAAMAARALSAVAARLTWDVLGAELRGFWERAARATSPDPSGTARSPGSS